MNRLLFICFDLKKDIDLTEPQYLFLNSCNLFLSLPTTVIPMMSLAPVQARPPVPVQVPVPAPPAAAADQGAATLEAARTLAASQILTLRNQTRSLNHKISPTLMEQR